MAAAFGEYVRTTDVWKAEGYQFIASVNTCPFHPSKGNSKILFSDTHVRIWLDRSISYKLPRSGQVDLYVQIFKRKSKEGERFLLNLSTSMTGVGGARVYHAPCRSCKKKTIAGGAAGGAGAAT